jgi:peptidoglycan/xylan/chitin deacetylase (PgdA/CDA1 family)
MRRLIKLLIASALYYSGLLRLRAKKDQLNRPDRRFKILTYHRVLDDANRKQADTQPGMCVTRSSFYKQLVYLKNNYNIISLDKLYELLNNGETVPERTVAVTFDDGWIDNYTIAYPVLRELNLPATIFVATDMINSGELPVFIHASLLLGESDIWPRKAVEAFQRVVRENDLAPAQPAFASDKLEACGNNAFDFMVTFMLLKTAQMDQLLALMMEAGGIDANDWYAKRWLINWDEVREMNRSVISFGSHGQTHELMTELTLAQVEQELIASKRYIEQQMNEPVTIFSYPNGNYNEPIKQLVKKSGYIGAVTQTGCLDNETLPDRYALRRINLNEGATLGPLGRFSTTMFACKIEGLL